MNAEHTWADAPALGVLFETVLFDDMFRYDLKNFSPNFSYLFNKFFSYDENGNLKNSSDFKEKPPLPSRLKWDLSNETLVKNIEQAYQEALEIVNVRKTTLKKYSKSTFDNFRTLTISFTNMIHSEKDLSKLVKFHLMASYKWHFNSHIIVKWENSPTLMKRQ